MSNSPSSRGDNTENLARRERTTARITIALVVSFVALVAMLAWLALQSIEAQIREDAGNSLDTVLHTTHESLRIWIADRKDYLEQLSSDPRLVQSVQKQLAVPHTPGELLQAPSHKELREYFDTQRDRYGHTGFFVISPGYINIGSMRDQNVGVTNLIADQRRPLLELAFQGKTVFIPPIESDVPLPLSPDRMVARAPTMFVAGPVRDAAGQVIAVLTLRIDPRGKFSRIIARARFGETGESYAFDQHGTLLTASRFEEQLRAVGLIGPTAEAALAMQVRDPGGNLLEGFIPAIPHAQQPLTYMAERALAGEPGLNTLGYRDYRGVPVLGAWLWDDETGFGLATEIDVDDALHPYYDTRRTVLGVVGVSSVLSLLLIFVLGLMRSRISNTLRKARDDLEVRVQDRTREILDAHRFLDDLLESTPDAMLNVSREGRIVRVNSQAQRLFGYSRDELLGMSVEDLMPVRFRQHHTGLREDYFQQPAARAMGEGRDLVACSKAGEEIPVEISLAYTGDAANIQAIAAIRDITRRKKVEVALRQSAAVFDNTDEGIIITDADRNIITVNKAFSEISGYQPGEVLGKNPRFHQSGLHDDAFYAKLWETVNKRGQWRGEIWNRRKSGELYPAWENISVVRNEQGRVQNYISVFSDISVLKESETRLTYLAHHDALTGLPNRLRFTANLEQALQHAERHRHKVALLFLDLDRFKSINDSRGHAYGDRLLQTVADRLSQCVRSEDTVARLGGDEFTVILTEIARAEDAGLMAEKIIKVISAAVALDGHSLVPSTSIGISVYPDDADSSGELVKAADAAMYHAKDSGRGNYRFYTTELTSKAQHHRSIESGLRQALGRGEFELYYQPQVTLDGGKLVGVEALIRWRHREKGLLLPQEFLHVAEASGLIEELGGWVLETAQAQARAWQADNLPPMRIAVNVSGHQLLAPEGVERFKNRLRDLDIHPGELQFVIEITEDVLLSVEQHQSALAEVQALGVLLAIDDFGTGCSSLSCLKFLPIDAIKIDKSIVQDIPGNTDHEAIAAAIVSMAHSLELSVIGEGIETREQAEFLQRLGCDEGQGYLYSEPLSVEAISELLRKPARREG